MGKKDMTEKEMFLKNRKHIFTIEQKVTSNKLTINELDEIIPGYLHLNRLPDMAMTYVSQSGCNMFEHSNQELVERFGELTDIYVDMEFLIKTSFSALIKFSQLNDYNNTFSFYEKIRLNSNSFFELYCTEIKLLPGNQELICITNPVSKLNTTTKRLNGILNENKFFNDNFQKFMSLTKQEKNILKLIALGLQNKTISEQLFISTNTIKTHRRNINKKLEAKHLNDLIKYANVFGLI